MTNCITLPLWLDDLIFKTFKARCCHQYSDMTNIDDDKEKTLNYLGTYFPRSYAESYCIFSEYFETHKSAYTCKDELSIFDFGSGTGGEIIGLLTALSELFPNIQNVSILALDGNQHALRLYEKILNKFQGKVNIQINNRTSAVKIDDFYDLSLIDSIVTEKFDLIVSFKAICEFVTKQQFEQNNPYSHIASFLIPKLKYDGILFLEDITTRNDVSQEWLPKMMDNGLSNLKCTLIGKNEGYNQTYYITHSHKQKDKSNVAWRMIKR